MTPLSTIRDNLYKALQCWRGEQPTTNISTAPVGQLYLWFSIIRDDSLSDDNYQLAEFCQQNMTILLNGTYLPC